MVENVNRTHFILTNKLIKRTQNNLDLYLNIKPITLLGKYLIKQLYKETLSL